MDPLKRSAKVAADAAFNPARKEPSRQRGLPRRFLSLAASAAGLQMAAIYHAFMTADEIKKLLGLQPHPCEGGWFVQTWRSEELVPQGALPERYSSARHAGTCIYYLLEPGTFSEMHRLESDEVFHFYLGDPVEMLQIASDGRAQRYVLGSDLAAGQHVQLVVPRNVWQGSRLVDGGSVALLGCSVSPGFDYADYESGTREKLLDKCGEYPELMTGLCRN
jgi:predicted cupin superfamily sugar epimerase